MRATGAVTCVEGGVWVHRELQVVRAFTLMVTQPGDFYDQGIGPTATTLYI